MTKATLFCDPLSLYHEPPKRKEKYQLFDCPQCDDKMWVSEKKKELIKIIDDLLLICRLCFDKKLDEKYKDDDYK
jgi:hypothetical protein